MAVILTDHQLLARLVSFDSTSANSNVPIADFVCEYLAGPHVEILRLPAANDSKVNLVIRVLPPDHGGEEQDGLILSGHLDVVPATEPEWLTNPFELAETATDYIGRGACDMKGFDALAINIAKRASEGNLTRPLVLILTCDEELGLLGALHLAETWTSPFPLPKSAIIGEPTSLRVVRMHKGQLKMRLTCRGKSAHTGYPDLGINAIEPAARAVSALADLRRELRAEPTTTSEFFPETPFVALNVTMINGGTATNIVPDRCRVEISVRTMPGMAPEPLVERVRAAVADCGDLGDYSLERTGYGPPLLTKEDAPIYRSLCKLVDQRETYGVSYASDAGPLQQMGLECVLLGPGNIEVAHKPNESLPKDEFVRARELLDRVVREYCYA